MNVRFVIAAALVAAIPALAAAQAASPYAGQQARDVKTLSPEQIHGYLTGEGLGMAKAGELNHYPGPKHVLALAQQLGISGEQRRRITAISRVMTAGALPLGRSIVDAERELDLAFAKGTVNDRGLTQRTRHIADLEGRLRAVHLSAHLATRKVLTVSQVAAYDRLRGYGMHADGAMQHHHDE
jgi:hypothetical protein